MIKIVKGFCMEKICAVIVTYNRPELLCRCVEHLYGPNEYEHTLIMSMINKMKN